MKKFIIAMAAFGLSSAAMAGPSWTYAELNYVLGDSIENVGGAGGDSDLTGYNLQGSLAFLDMFHAAAEYGTLDTGDAPFGFGDIDVMGLRLGIHPAVTDSTDLYLELGITQYDLDDAPTTTEPSEIDLAVGLRSMLSDKVEVRGGITIAQGDLDTSNDDYTDTRFNVGGAYHFTDALSVDIDYTTVGDGLAGAGGQDTVELGVRWSFGNIL